MANKEDSKFLLKVKSETPSISDIKEAAHWLVGDFKSKERNQPFGFIYRCYYEYSKASNSFKVILPLSQEEHFLIVFDILSMNLELRAAFLDLITSDGQILQMDDKLFSKIKTNRLIRNSVRKLWIKDIKKLEMISYSDLDLVINLPQVTSSGKDEWHQK